MANRHPCGYGGDNSREMHEIQHSKVDIMSMHQEPFVIRYAILPPDDDIMMIIKAKCFPLFKAFMLRCAEAGGYACPRNHSDERDDQLDKQQPKKSAAITYKPKVIKENANKRKNIFRILQDCYTGHYNQLGFIAVEYNWKERHLKLEQGLNLLALCKNYDCVNHIEGVVCPRGIFRDRNGYCPLDMELYKVKCPSCKQRIIPDESFGFGFYDCDFEISYKLVEQKEHRMKQEGSANIFYFRKLSVSWNLFEYLEAQISIPTFL